MSSPPSVHPDEATKQAAASTPIPSATTGTPENTVSTWLRYGFSGTLEEAMVQNIELMNGMVDELEKLGTPREIVPFHYMGSIWALGPKNEKELVLVRFDLDSGSDPAEGVALWPSAKSSRSATASIVPMTGMMPDAARLFKKMPFHCVLGSNLILAFSVNEPEVSRFEVYSLDLEGFGMEKLAIGGRAPPMELNVGWDACVWGGKLHVVSSPGTALFSADLLASNSPPTWVESPISGETCPTKPTCSSICYQGNMWVFEEHGNSAHILDLSKPGWTRVELKGAPKTNLKNFHLIKTSGKHAVLIRGSDNSQIHLLDMEAMIWKRQQAIGLRPGNYASDPSYVIVNGIVYTFGGQSAGKHVLATNQVRRGPHAAVAASSPARGIGANANADRVNSLTSIQLLQPPTEEALVKKRISSMRSQRWGDITFKFSGGGSLTAHKIMLSPNPKLAEMMDEERTVDFSRQPETSSFSFPTFDLFVDYFYEKLDLSSRTEEEWCNLYAMADYFTESRLTLKILEALESLRQGSIAAHLKFFKLSRELKSTPCNRELKRKAEAELGRNAKRLCASEEFHAFSAENPTLLPSLLRLIGKNLN